MGPARLPKPAGMGTVTQRLAAAAIEAGARIHTSSPVASVEVQGGAAAAVVLADGRRVAAKAVVGGCGARGRR